MSTKIKYLIAAMLLTVTLSTYAQPHTGAIKGTAEDRTSREAIHLATVTLDNGTEQHTATTNQAGEFTFEALPPGTWTLTIATEGYAPYEAHISTLNSVVNTGKILLQPQITAMTGIPDFNVFETGDDNDVQMTSALLSSSQDAFSGIASYKFGAMRFKTRGYDYGQTKVHMNGLPMNDINTGNSPFSLWGGLNDATRNQETTLGMLPADYSIGALGGSSNILANASQVRKGFRLSYANTNNSYNNRVMATYADEVGDGLFVALSVSTRLGASDGVFNHTKGLFYEGFSYFMSIEKKFGQRHSLSLTGFGAPLRRGAQMAATQEAYDLVHDNYYNPNWGWQSDDMRNARVRSAHEPVLMLNYVFRPNNKLKLSSALSYRFGYNGYSALDWYDAPDPRPDYYRYLPSYYEQTDPVKALVMREGWQVDPDIRHLNWSRLYNVNYNNFHTQTGATNNGLFNQTVTGLRSKYVVEERHTDQRDINAGLTANYILNDYLKINAGANYRWNRTEYFKTMKDLLGGEYWVDIDQFAERDFPNSMAIQNDLNNPNRIIYEGDKYGYDYFAHTQTGALWATAGLNWQKLEGYLGASVGITSFYREGLYKKGLFPEESYGNSETQSFTNYHLKAGASYKFTGHHVLSGNFSYQQQAPWFQEAFLSPRTRNSIVDGLTTEKTLSADLSYTFRLPTAKIRLTGYFTKIMDQTKVMSFYDDISRTFSNYSLRDIDQRHVGLELGADITLWQGLSLVGALSYGDYVYTSNPLLTQTQDNSQAIIMKDRRVYWENFYVSGTPQLATSIGLDYRAPRYLFAGIDLSYFDYTYIDMNPVRRTEIASKNLKDQNLINMVRQEKFDGGFVLNADIGAMFQIRYKYTIGINFQVNNILNNTKLKSGGFEQSRLSYDSDKDQYTPFDSKYYYMYGTTYFLNVYFRF
jgi:hypothetical protein